MKWIVLALSLMPVSAVFAWRPAKLEPYPQKFRTFFSLADTNASKALSAEARSLPVGGVTAFALGPTNVLWLGTTQGLLRLDSKASITDRLQYFAGQRYLPDDAVDQVVPDSRNGVWVRCRTGISHIELRPMTLAAKAEIFEQRIQARHNRYGLVADSRLRKPGDVTSSEPMDSDNDGLWTSIYAAAECFRFAVTHSSSALTNARRSIDAMLFLEEVAGKRGFPARSFVHKGDPLPQGGEWHWTADGQYYWKGDTSSDEIVGHFFIFSIASDLLPDPALKQKIVATTRRIMDHILDHHYTLVGLDGKPTTWGWWSPEILVNQPDERALNSLQLLSFLKTAAHITGERRYEDEYRKLIRDFNYPDWMTRVNEFRQEMNYSDEELAMLPFYCLFQYEHDPSLVAQYRRALDAWWQNIKREENPLWTFIYQLAQPAVHADLAAAVHTLYRTPIDTVCWSVRNSNRNDIRWASELDRFGARQALTLLPPDERPVMRWNSNPFNLDGGDGGGAEDDGAAFLLPYWLGRYHRLLKGE